jgi:hypothetical protein
LAPSRDLFSAAVELDEQTSISSWSAAHAAQRVAQLAVHVRDGLRTPLPR